MVRELARSQPVIVENDVICDDVGSQLARRSIADGRRLLQEEDRGSVFVYDISGIK